MRVLSAERGTCAQQADVRQRVLQERVAALEALRQFLLLGDRRGQAVGRPDLACDSRLKWAGFQADEVQINVTGDMLTIRGELKHEEENKDKTGEWKFKVDASKATGFFKISLQSY